MSLLFRISSAAVALGIAITLFAPIGSAYAASDLLNGLVPACGTRSSDVKNPDGSTTVTYTPCDTCHLVQLIKNFVDFLAKYVTVAGGALMLMIAGFQMVTGGLAGSPVGYQKGLHTARNAFIGIAIVLFSWLAVDTIIKFVAQRVSILDSTPAILPKGKETLQVEETQQSPITTSAFGPWNELKCTTLHSVEVKTEPKKAEPAPTPPSAPTPVTPGAPAPGGPPLDEILRNQQNAADLQTRGVTASSASDCGSVSARTNFQELRTGQSLTACSATCTATSGCASSGKTADPRMLEDLMWLTLSGREYQISSIATGAHASNSAHYQGKAIDLVPKGDTTFAQLRAAMAERNPDSPRVYCENNRGDVIAGCGAGSTHVHVTYR